MLTWIAAATLLAWLVLMFARGGFWRTHPAAVPSAPEREVWPHVVVVVPARNEVAAIGATLKSLGAQDYPGILSVIVVDDCSSDGTAAAARDAAGMARFTLIRGRPRQPGWTGKLWALQQGLGGTCGQWSCAPPTTRWASRHFGLCSASSACSFYQAPWIVTAWALYSGAPIPGALSVAAMLLMLYCYAPTVSSFGPSRRVGADTSAGGDGLHPDDR